MAKLSKLTIDFYLPVKAKTHSTSKDRLIGCISSDRPGQSKGRSIPIKDELRHEDTMKVMSVKAPVAAFRIPPGGSH